MAVIPSTIIPGLKVIVEVPGTTAEEHENRNDKAPPMKADQFDLPAAHDEATDLPCVVRYIEAVPGQLFRIRVIKEAHFQQSTHHIAYRVFIDNESMAWAQEMRDPGQRWESMRDSCYSGNPTVGYKSHKFQFAALNIAETHLSKEELEHQRALANRCGTLRVAVFRMRRCGPSSPSQRNIPAPALGLTDFAEKAMKGTSADCTTTFISETSRQPRRAERKHKDPKERPFAIFEFRYRSREGLMNEGIISRRSVAEQVQAMTEEELRQRLTQIMEETERSAAGNSQQPSRGLKREADEEMTDDQFMARYKARRLENGKMEVDLTLDD